MNLNDFYIPDLTAEIQSLIEAKLRAEREAEIEKLFQPVAPFSAKELTEKAKQERLGKMENGKWEMENGLATAKLHSEAGFWFFDKTYFPVEIYQSYYKPGWFHKEIVSITDLHDKILHMILAGRDIAKTLHFKKKIWYDILTGQRKLIGFGSEIMTTAYRFLADTKFLLQTNERIKNDLEIELVEKSNEGIFCRSILNPRGSFIIPFSYDRSTKGTQRAFDRLDYFYVTDFENATSSLTKEAREKKYDVLNEARTSLTDTGTGICDGNNFHVDTLMNQLCEEEAKGILSEFVKIHKYKHWDNTRAHYKKSIWYNKYPAVDEANFWAMVKPKDEYDKDGSYNQEPRLRGGDVFPVVYYQEWNELPKDVKAVTYADPNCSLKQKGDTTAMGCFGFSVSEQKFYVTTANCKSYFDSNLLLSDYLQLWANERERKISVIAMGMDGNVTQESIWSNNLLQYSRINKMPYPYVLFKKYKVDDIVTSVEAIYKNNGILFPPGFSKTEQGKIFLKQFHNFKTKKAKKKDDAPDFIICAYQLLIDLGIQFVQSGGAKVYSVSNRQVKKL